MKISTLAILATTAAPCWAGLAEDYPGSWRTDAPASIVRTLASNNVKGCGEFAYRQRANGSQEYLVYCTRDGTSWAAWLAWTASNKVQGPYAPDTSLLPPK
jgi:hypothetical protein